MLALISHHVCVTLRPAELLVVLLFRLRLALKHTIHHMELHQSIAFVAHSVLLRVVLAKPSFLLAASVADGLAATFAIVFEYQPPLPKRFAAQHAKARVQLNYAVDV